MSKRIEHLSESPCYQCGKMQECMNKIARNSMLGDIMDSVMPRADMDFHNCSLWKVLKMEEKHGE